MSSHRPFLLPPPWLNYHPAPGKAAGDGRRVRTFGEFHGNFTWRENPGTKQEPNRNQTGTKQEPNRNHVFFFFFYQGVELGATHQLRNVGNFHWSVGTNWHQTKMIQCHAVGCLGLACCFQFADHPNLMTSYWLAMSFFQHVFMTQ